MAARNQYTEEFKRRVLDEYKKGDLTLEEVAAKYNIPAALLQDWVNKDGLNDIFIKYVEKPVEEKTFRTSINALGVAAFQKIKANGWLLAGCLPLLISLVTYIAFNKSVIESELNENMQSTEVKMDSLININTELKNELKGEIGELGITLEKIDNELETKIAPNISINNDNRKTINKTKRKTTSTTKVEINNHVEKEAAGKKMVSDSCCCRCRKDSIR